MNGTIILQISLSSVKNHRSKRAKQVTARRRYEKQFIVVFSLILKTIVEKALNRLLLSIDERTDNSMLSSHDRVGRRVSSY